MLRVLIVDDEDSARKVMAAVLAQLGLPCETAASAEEALRTLETHRMDAVISDLQMPGKASLDLLAKVRKIYPQLVFLMVTGVDDIRVGIQAMQQGADDYPRDTRSGRNLRFEFDQGKLTSQWMRVCLKNKDFQPVGGFDESLSGCNLDVCFVCGHAGRRVPKAS